MPAPGWTPQLQYQAKAEVSVEAFTPAETVTVDKWFILPGIPRRFPKRLVNTGQFSLTLDVTQTPETILLSSYWRQPSEPRRFPKPFPRIGYSVLELDAGQRPETILPSSWWQQASEPRMYGRALLTALQQAFALQLETIQYSEVVLPSSWWQQAQEPQMQPRRLVRTGEFALTLDQTQTPVTPFLDAWFQNTATPKRFRKPLVPTGLAVLTLDNAQTPEQVFLGWMPQSADPKRFIRRSLAALVAGGFYVHDGIADVFIPLPDQPWVQLPDPVRRRGQRVREGWSVLQLTTAQYPEAVLLAWYPQNAERPRTLLRRLAALVAGNTYVHDGQADPITLAFYRVAQMTGKGHNIYDRPGSSLARSSTSGGSGHAKAGPNPSSGR